MRIPLDLVAIIGRNEIWNPLNTADFAEARRYCFPARAELHKAFAQARRRRDTHGRLSGEEALHIVRTWFRETDRRAANMDFGLLGDDVRAALGETEQDLLDLIEGGDGETIQAALDRALISGGWPARAHHIGSISTKRIKLVEVDGSAQAELSELMRRALVELARRRRERLRGSPN